MMKKEIFKNIDIITPCFNGERFIKNFYNRIRDISTEINIIFINDKSIDKTASVISDLMKHDEKIILINNKKNIGPAQSRLAGVDVSERSYISFIDIDDLPSLYKFEIQVQAMIKTNSKWSYHAMRINNRDIFCKQIKTKYDLYAKRYIGLSSVIIHKDIKKNLYIKHSYRNGEDYIWWFNLFNKIGPPLYVKGIYYDYYINSDGLSKNKLKQAQKILSIYFDNRLSHLNFFESTIFFFSYAINGIINAKKNIT